VSRRRAVAAAPAPAPAPERISIQYFAIDEIQRWPRNPKLHADEKLDVSLEQFGYVQPMLRDERTGRLVAGHGRLDRLLAWKASGREPPKRILVGPEGQWLAPVTCGVSFESEASAEAYLVADNRLVELGGWDATMLSDLYQGLEGGLRAGSGFEQKDVEQLLADFQREQRKAERAAEPEVPVPPKHPVTKKGDLWRLGDHLLLCGDSTVPGDVARVMEGAKADLLATDPPYGVNYDEIRESNAKATGGKIPDYDPIANDGLQGAALQAFLAAFLAAIKPHFGERPAIYIWHPVLLESLPFIEAVKTIDLLIHRQIVWVKPSLIMGRGDFHWRHETALYGWIRGRRSRWFGKRDLDTVWEVGRENDRIHPTQKPVALFSRPMDLHTLEGEVCFEPFAGSGSQVIAAEEMGRRCRAIEFAPGYCDAIVQRWEERSGKKAKRA